MSIFLQNLFNREDYSYAYSELQTQIMKKLNTNILVESTIQLSTKKLKPKTLKILDEVLWDLILEKKIIVSFFDLDSSNLKFRKASNY